MMTLLQAALLFKTDAGKRERKTENETESESETETRRKHIIKMPSLVEAEH